MIAERPTVTGIAWPRCLDQYGAPDTYRLSAEWLKDCATVADWGGATGHFRTHLPPTVAYTLVDGTLQTSDQVLADLVTYTEPSDGILLRHVLDNTHEWEPIVRNALQAFRRRMVVVTFVPDGPLTKRIDHRNGWPYWQFKLDDLRALMGSLLVCDRSVPTTHPEHIFYLERR